MKNKALFLDRDGIINIDKGYVFKFKDIEWVEGIFDLITYANSHGFLVIVLTNQSGIAKGMYKEHDVVLLHSQMSAFLASKNLRIDDWFYCPFDHGVRRKPAPGMMIEAQLKYDIDLDNSFMIGDKVTDVIDISGPTTFLIRGNYPLDEKIISHKVKIFDDLFQVLDELKNRPC